MIDREAGGQFFREAWITGVHKHYPGTPKESYIKPWSDMDEWEKQSAIAVYHQIAGFIRAGLKTTLTREQGGRLVRMAWVAQMYKHFQDPKPAYVSDWDEMASQWEREVDMDIFEAIQQSVHQAV